MQCNICGNKDTYFFRKALCLSPKRESFSLVRCKNCGLIYLNPRPSKEELAGFYVFWPDVALDKQPPRPISEALWRAQRIKIKFLKGYITNKTGKILDVGTGSGEFLKLMQDRGWEVFGVEYGKASSSFARQYPGLNIFNGDLLETRFLADYFDIITLWDSLEHLYQPKETLQEIKRILKPDGLLAFSVPNIDNLAALIFRDHWYTNVPRHLYQFSPKTIRLLLKEANFRILKIIYSPGFFEPVGFVVSFKQWLISKLTISQPALQSGGLANNSPRNLVKNILWLLAEFVFLPLSILSLLIKKAPNMVVLAIKG